MTVSELIEELKKQPAHYPVYLVVNVPDPMSGAQSDEWRPIEDIHVKTNLGDIGCVVKLEG